MRVRPLLTIFTALAALLLTSCAEDDPEPIVPSATAAPPETPTVTAEPETPEEFIRRWSQVQTDMQNTGDTSEYEALNQGCSGCDALAKIVREYYDAGGWIKWRGWQIREIRTWPDGPDEFEVIVDSDPTRYRKSAGAETRSTDGGRVHYVLALAQTGEGWKVVEKALASR